MFQGVARLLGIPAGMILFSASLPRFWHVQKETSSNVVIQCYPREIRSRRAGLQGNIPDVGRYCCIGLTNKKLTSYKLFVIQPL